MDMLRVTFAQRILPCVGAELARPVVTTQKDPASVFRLQPPQPRCAKQRVRVAGQMTLTRRTSSVEAAHPQVQGWGGPRSAPTAYGSGSGSGSGSEGVARRTV